MAPGAPARLICSLAMAGLLVLGSCSSGASDSDASAGPDSGPGGTTGGTGNSSNYFVDALPADGCLPRQGSLSSCRLVELLEETCSCEAPARAELAPDLLDAIHRHEGCGDTCSACACEIKAAPTAVALTECLEQASVAADAYGWCVIDELGGDPSLIPHCSEGRGLRFLGDSAPAAGAKLRLACGSR